MRPAVFLDRDDTLNANADLDWAAITAGRPRLRPGDLVDPDRLALLPGVLDACAALADAGFALVVVTNQSSVAMGGATLAEVDATNARLDALLHRGTRRLLTAIYSAPYHPQGIVHPFNTDHPDRKPGGGMLRRAAREHGLDLNASWIVGDKARDVEAGLDAGLVPERCLLIGPGAPLPDLAAAARTILRQTAPGRVG